MDAANIAIRPAHGFDVVEAIIIGLEHLGYVYEFHGLRFLRTMRTARTIRAMIPATANSIVYGGASILKAYQETAFCVKCIIVA